MRRSTKKYIASAAGIGAVAIGLPVVATAPAYAADRCEKAAVEYSLDGGQTWTSGGRMDGPKADKVAKIQVRLKNEVKNSCEYAVSLASYSAEGPTWSSSGKQAFLGWDTTKLNKQTKLATLDVSEFAPKCYGQIDLYGNGKKYDGVEKPLPHYPDAPFPKDLITAWNGGEKCETPPTTPPATTPPATTAPATTAPPTSATTAPATSKPPTSTSASPSASTSKPPTSSAPVPTSTDTQAPVGQPEVPPTTETAPPALADTGGDSNAPVVIGVSAGVLLVGGAGALLWSRRRNNGATPA
ncbi:LAETG motif-containing sortase-dependent surface protein [Yinghuangia sp. YIM S09857]|uniref:LAETG motif-containing sortase-dependent surface protein n=1 Tax=Yinghuangia sp. YIM S09857 TaxID=3436929 RepID=UPI003F52D780